MQDPVSVNLTSDATTALMTDITQLDPRHTQKLIIGYLDGHAALVASDGEGDGIIIGPVLNVISGATATGSGMTSPSYVVDGIIGTEASSLNWVSSLSGSWLQIDLGASHSVDGFEIYNVGTIAGYYNYSMQAADIYVDNIAGGTGHTTRLTQLTAIPETQSDTVTATTGKSAAPLPRDAI